MKLDQILEKNKAVILQGWVEIILKAYPDETSRFIKSRKDRFDNPVGHAISTGVEGIFNCLVEGGNERIASFIDDIIRIRAVQDFRPGQAVGFMFQLKSVIRDVVADDLARQDAGLVRELLEFESRIDEQAKLAFDIYMKCRERLYELKTDEFKRNTFRLLQQANLICEVEGQDASAN
ncbi:MAG: RsbRD N-terminal domain-containing protein [Nitrospirae bacterium]|nr:RsbRD N-terminal domain-containing protein [Nitrospirota bacterium]